jgi:hypothetical protein
MSRLTHKAIYSILANDATVTGLVGTRIKPTFIPEGLAFPAVVYRITEKQPQDTKDGVIGSIDTLNIDIYDDGGEQIITIADAIRDALDRYRGTVQSVKIDKVIFEGESDEALIPELALFHLSQQYRIRIKY